MLNTGIAGTGLSSDFDCNPSERIAATLLGYAKIIGDLNTLFLLEKCN